MNRRLASALAYTCTVAAATLASAVMTVPAIAESPLAVPAQPFVSTRTRAEVQAELMGQRLSSAGSEWVLQANAPQQRTSSITRAQATADYIASRDAIHALNSEDSGSAYLAQSPMRARSTMVAGSRESN